MNVLICDNYAELSAKAADFVAKEISANPAACLGFATGSTPEGMYDCLIDLYKAGKCDFSRVTTFNLDEYYPITPDNVQSYRYFMDKHLFDHVNINKCMTNVPNGNTADPQLECAEYENRIEEAGGIALQVIGVGPNGHIGFNEPDGYLYPNTHVTTLSERTIQANSRFFDSVDEMPKKAITMGMKSILSSRRIVALASGAVKHEAISKLMSGRITTEWPVTLLNLHSDVILICDREAYYGK